LREQLLQSCVEPVEGVESASSTAWMAIQLSSKVTENPTEKITKNAVLQKAMPYSTRSVTFSVGFRVAFPEGN